MLVGVAVIFGCFNSSQLLTSSSVLAVTPGRMGKIVSGQIRSAAGADRISGQMIEVLVE